MEFIKCEYCGYESDIVPYKANARIAELEEIVAHQGKHILPQAERIDSLKAEIKKLREEKDEQSIINIYFDVWLDSNGEEHTANVYHNKILKLAYGGDPENVIKAIKELLEQLKQQK